MTDCPVTTRPLAVAPSFASLGIPASWYRVAWSDELEVGSVIRLRYFGRDLVAYRGAAGTVAVLDAHCPHLGAHLGYGGTVEEDCIVCPFHGWSWNADGTNAGVPYGRVRTGPTIGVWPSIEINGMVMVWYHPAAKPPDWTPPAVEAFNSAAFCAVTADRRRVSAGVRVHPQQQVENTVDPAHIRFVHRSTSIPPSVAWQPTAHTFTTTLNYQWGEGRDRTWLTPDGPVDGGLVAECHGMGMTVTSFIGIHPTVEIVGCTPIDAERSDFFVAIACAREPLGTLPAEIAADRLARHMFDQIDADLPIWEHQRIVEHPPHPRLEARAYTAMRQWTRRFFGDDASIPEAGTVRLEATG